MRHGIDGNRFPLHMVIVIEIIREPFQAENAHAVAYGLEPR